MPETLQVALVGYGFVGKLFHAPLISAVHGLTLHSVVSSNAVAVHADHPEARVSPDLGVVLADPAVQLIVIATPNVLHASQAHAALDAGKHVIVDKPFTVTVAEADAVIEHAARAGRVLSVFHNRRYDSDFLTLQQLIASGALGEVTQFESHFDRFRLEVRDRWRERSGPGAGLWYDLAPHLLDQALQFDMQRVGAGLRFGGFAACAVQALRSVGVGSFQAHRRRLAVVGDQRLRALLVAQVFDFLRAGQHAGLF